LKTINFAQKLKNISYGIMSNEDEEAHLFIFQNTKDELERIVNERLEKNLPLE